MRKFLLNLGGEPAGIVGAVQAVLALLVGFGALGFAGIDSDADVALVVGVVAALSALYLAFTTTGTVLAPIIEVVKAVLALGAIYGLTITAEQTGLLIGAITMVVSLYQRGQVSPMETPSLSAVSVVPSDHEIEDHGDDEALDTGDVEADDDDLETLPIGDEFTHSHGEPDDWDNLDAPEPASPDRYGDPRYEAWPSHDR